MTGSDQEASKARVAPELHNSLDVPILLLSVSPRSYTIL